MDDQDQSSNDERMAWLGVAHEIVSEWESRSGVRRLSVLDASTLAERIARALERAYAQEDKVGAEVKCFGKVIRPDLST